MVSGNASKHATVKPQSPYTAEDLRELAGQAVRELGPVP